MAKIFITRQIPQVGIDMLIDHGHQVHVGGNTQLSKEELIREVRGGGYEGIVSLLTDQIDEEVFDAMPQLKIVSNYAVGYNNIDIEEAKKRNIIVTNTPDVLTDTVAEFTIALMLALLHRIPEADTFTRRGYYKGWEPELLVGTNIKDKTLGLIGVGRIGTVVGSYAKALGATLIYTDITEQKEFERATNATFYKTVDDVCKKSDIISLHVPLLPSTHHLIGREQIQNMKKSAYLINTARGPVVDEKVLVEALRNSEIAGAALDVFEFEPKLSPGLIELSNVILTPHIASATKEAREGMALLAAANIIDMFSGEGVKNVIQ